LHVEEKKQQKRSKTTTKYNTL